uniref:Uncharacterized protein n=1 Tax=Setaria viridis TaxID=4556 RepID=A0A4U6TBK5_SETVI|nr:hypothetical protein SEVIR_8G043366v2 [Setaria viridis]
MIEASPAPSSTARTSLRSLLTSLRLPLPPSLRSLATPTSLLLFLLLRHPLLQTSPAHEPFLSNTPAANRCRAKDHQVCDCRDPVRCRRTSHRGYACTMVSPREHTPHRRRRPTIPVPATPVPLNAVPFTPRASSPASATPAPPPTPLNLPPFTAAFDPLRMLASSSSGPVTDQQLPSPARSHVPEDEPYFLGDLFREPANKGKRPVQNCARTASPRATPPVPKARDIRMVGGVSPCNRGASTPSSRSSARSPPPPPPPSHRASLCLALHQHAPVLAHMNFPPMELHLPSPNRCTTLQKKFLWRVMSKYRGQTTWRSG